AGEAHTVAWEVTAPVGAHTLRYEIEAGEAGGRMDRVVVAQQVVAAVSVRTFQATLFQWDPRQRIMRQAVERPADAVPGRGGVQIALRPTLVEGLDALRGWMRAYPYTCLEQLVSRAVALRDEAQWRIVLNALPARLNLQGTTMGFSTERSDALWWLMVSSDSNAVRLILALLDADKWRDDLPRLVGGALARQQRGAWDLTTANAWGVLALEKFSRSFERTPVGGRTSATLAAVSQRIDWLAVPKGGTLALPWPTERSEVALSHEGSGQPWITVQAQAAIPLAAPLSSGYKIAKTITPIEQ